MKRSLFKVAAVLLAVALTAMGVEVLVNLCLYVRDGRYVSAREGSKRRRLQLPPSRTDCRRRFAVAEGSSSSARCAGGRRVAQRRRIGVCRNRVRSSLG
jgi:hypothetical protein